MGRRTLQFPIFPATGGLQSANNPALVSPNNLKDINNIIFTNDNSRKRRPGLRKFNSTDTQTENFQMLFDFWRLNNITGNQSNQVTRIINGRFEADNNGDGAFQDKTNSMLISSTDVVTMDVFSGIQVLAFQNRLPLKYDQTTLTNLAGSPPNASIFRTHAGFGWLAGVKNNPHAVYRSFADNPQVWSGTGTEIITVDDGDGDPEGITALFPSFYGDLYVAKRKSLYRIRADFSTGSLLFAVTLVVRGIGCISHNSVVPLQNDIIFCSERGVHSLVATDKYGDAESSFLSANIHDIYNDQIDFSRSKQISATYSPEFQSYIMTVPLKGSSYNRDVLGYNILTGQWYRFKDINAQVVTQFIDSKSKTRLMIGDRQGRVGVFDTLTFLDYNQNIIPVSFQTGVIYPLGAKRSISFKSLTVIYVPQGNSVFTVDYSIDGQKIDTLSFDQSGGDATPLGQPFILGTASLGQKGTIKVESHPLSGNGRGIQLSFNRQPTENDASQGIEVLGYVIEYMDSEESDEASVQ